MRILFAGTPEIAIPSLKKLYENNYNIVGVLTSPDKPNKRGKLTQCPIKELALSLSLDVYTPHKIDDKFNQTIKELELDLLVVFAYGKIFPESFLSLFKKGGINIHPSLLPKYRGPSPLVATILSEDEFYGITIQELALKMDSGDILLQEKYPLQNETAKELTEIVAEKSPELLIQIMQRIEKGTLNPIPQNHEEATYCHLIKKEDGIIDWNKSANLISKEIRAFQPWPGSKTTINGKTLFLRNAIPNLATSEEKPGTILSVTKDNIVIQTGDGTLEIKTLQWENRKELSVKDFLNGYKLQKNMRME